jgi:hypothetical protein
MKNKYIFSILILCSVAAVNVSADDASTTAAPDPTILFFTSLSSCTPGDYQEHNSLSSEVGPTFLKQTIIGQDKGVCNVQLSTPDNRQMTCAFDMNDLSGLSDQHFLDGITSDASDTTDTNAVNSDMVWSNLKTNSCNFTQ